MKRSFSLLEMIFIITIIAIISVVAIPKLFDSIKEANITKLRADVALIRNGINQFNHKQTLQNTNQSLDSLENPDNRIMPILSTENSSGKWSKVSDNTYNAWISSTIGVEFIYNQSEASFDCDFKVDDNNCKNLTQ